MKANPNEEVLTTDQVAVLLQMRPVAVRNAVKAGTLPCLKIEDLLKSAKKRKIKRNMIG